MIDHPAFEAIFTETFVFIEKKKVKRQHQGMDGPGVHQVPEGSGEQRKVEETGCEVVLWCPNDPHGSGIGDGGEGCLHVFM